MLWSQLHQYQTRATGPRSQPGLRSFDMRFTRIQIIGILLILGLCQAATVRKSELTQEKIHKSIDEVNSEEESKYFEENTETQIKDDNFDLNEEVSDEDDKNSEQEGVDDDGLPILPPIILLDFGNGTDGENSTSEDKTKRTVNGGLGYGFERNIFHTGKYNYYFPAGKTGTTVSIEESISPFLPKTIIEKIQPSGQRTEITRLYGTPNRQNSFSNSGTASRVPNQNHYNFQYTTGEAALKSQPVFGLRTKLHKAPAAATSFQYQQFLSTPKPPVNRYVTPSQFYGSSAVPNPTTPSSIAYSPTESVGYVTPNPLSYTNSRGNSFNYLKPNPSRGQAVDVSSQFYSDEKENIQANVHPYSYSSQNEGNIETSTISPLNYNNAEIADLNSQYGNMPKYTIENGVRYEHKIFWKYPDGRVSDVPPATYVETYSEGPQSSRSQEAKSQSTIGIYESGSTETSIHSQGPVQFPVVPELSGQEPSQTPFISAESLSSSLPQQQVYRLGYQNLVTQKQTANLIQRAKANNTPGTLYTSGSSSSSSSGNLYSSRVPNGASKPNSKSPKNNYQSSTYLRPQVASKYMVNSPNPEYSNVYTTASPVKSTTPSRSFFTSSGELSPHITSRYTPKVQNYLKTIFPADGSPKKQSSSRKPLDNYANVQYSDLLNYNPSISEYIRNPSSILNVQPTFVQAGNSLIPVIILRVDGAPPSQPTPTSNINLKALLQQYLIQYANSIQELAQPSSYDFPGEQSPKDQSPSPSKSLLDLIQLTRNSAREPASYGRDSYTGKSSYETSNLRSDKGSINNKYGERSTARQKVKNVQILQDPRFMSYKVKN